MNNFTSNKYSDMILDFLNVLVHVNFVTLTFDCSIRVVDCSIRVFQLESLIPLQINVKSGLDTLVS